MQRDGTDAQETTGWLFDSRIRWGPQKGSGVRISDLAGLKVHSLFESNPVKSEIRTPDPELRRSISRFFQQKRVPHLRVHILGTSQDFWPGRGRKFDRICDASV